MAMNVFKASRLVLIAFAVSYLLSMVITNVTRTLKYEIGYVSLKHFSISRISQIFMILFSLKNTEMVRYQIKPNSWKIFIAVFIDLWPCLFTTKLCYAQLLKWGHSSKVAAVARYGYLVSSMLDLFGSHHERKLESVK